MPHAQAQGLPIATLMENWDFLQTQCAMYINSDLPGLPSSFHQTSKPLRCVACARVHVCCVVACVCVCVCAP